MILEIILIIAGFAVVLWGADRFTDGACGIARRLRVSELVIGLTVVAFGTSLPEFMVSLMSLLRGSSDMSVGNVVGSNVFNILVIIGSAAFLRKLAVDSPLLRRDLPLCLVASLMLFGFAFSGGGIARWEGLLLVAFFSFYLWLAYREAMKNRRETAVDAAAAEEKSMWLLILLLVLGLAALVLGARLLVDNAASLARRCGISESVIGLTILAGGTSLPELATSIVAARKGSFGLALGNVFGSNIFNIAFVIGLCSSVVPMAVTDIKPLDWAALLGSVALVWLVAFTRRSIEKWEGVLLVCSYLAYLATLLVH